MIPRSSERSALVLLRKVMDTSNSAVFRRAENSDVLATEPTCGTNELASIGRRRSVERFV